MSLTIDDHKFAIVLANSGLTIGEAAERAGMSRQSKFLLRCPYSMAYCYISLHSVGRCEYLEDYKL